MMTSTKMTMTMTMTMIMALEMDMCRKNYEADWYSTDGAFLGKCGHIGLK